MKLHLNTPNIQDDLGQLHSVVPCTEYLTFGAWLYLVPQYKPKSVLMLGYGGGTAAGLMRLFYGDVPITAVDMLDCSEFNYYDVNFVQKDALEYLRTCEKFDVITVDLFREGSYYAEPFVYGVEFAKLLSEKCNYGIVHAVVGDDMSAYKEFYKVRTLSLNTNSPYCPEFHYYIFNQNIPLPVR